MKFPKWKLYLMALLILLAAIAGYVSGSSNSDVVPVPVTVYYETLCPGSQQFIQYELFPTYTDRKYDYTSLISNLTLVPYGWVKIRDEKTHDYKCQHGKSECEGNKLQGCAIKYIPDITTTLNYITCLADHVMANYKSSRSKYPVDECTNQLPKGLYPIIMNYYNTDEGWDIFDENGVKTNSFFKSNGGFVPYVSFNGKKNDSLAHEASDNFKKTLSEVTGIKDETSSS